MKSVCAFLVVVCLSILLLAQTPTYAEFPYDQTLMQKKFNRDGQRYPGCLCGIGKGGTGQYLAETMEVSPTSIPNARVGQAVQIRYDASYICRKQGFRDMNGKDATNPYKPFDPQVHVGSADWEAGVKQDLPREYGIITFPGYSQSGRTYNVKIDISVRCVDVQGCAFPQGNNCTASATVPVTVK